MPPPKPRLVTPFRAGAVVGDAQRGTEPEHRGRAAQSAAVVQIDAAAVALAMVEAAHRRVPCAGLLRLPAQYRPPPRPSVPVARLLPTLAALISSSRPLPSTAPPPPRSARLWVRLLRSRITVPPSTRSAPPQARLPASPVTSPPLSSSSRRMIRRVLAVFRSMRRIRPLAPLARDQPGALPVVARERVGTAGEVAFDADVGGRIDQAIDIFDKGPAGGFDLGQRDLHPVRPGRIDGRGRQRRLQVGMGAGRVSRRTHTELGCLRCAGQQQTASQAQRPAERCPRQPMIWSSNPHAFPA
ncbi:MAG: hypothetical protein KatS3mg126_0831 [Lysobacteraceae bacterium]|nr:MAG: hypothetical protein KatS3mg126_0831 [Xanthomonadaceae bacterium]